MRLKSPKNFEDKSQKEKQETKVYKKSEGPAKEKNKTNSSTDRPQDEESQNNTESENNNSTDIVEDLPFEENETNAGQNSRIIHPVRNGGRRLSRTVHLPVGGLIRHP